MKRTVALAILAALLLTLCACGKVRQAEEAIDAIGNVTAESGAQIEAAEAAVEALNDKQRDKLPNLTVLEEAQTEYETVLEEQAETEACVQEAENAIDAIGSVTLDSGDAIRAARAAYDAVPEEAREQVTNRETLSAAEQTFDALAIQATTDAINAIGDVTLDSGEAIRAARELYDGFSGAIQSQVANRDVLVRDEEQFSALRVQHVNDLITDIGEVTLSSEDRIREAEDAYNALSESEAAAVTNHRALVEAREAFDTMEAAARLQVAIDDARSRLRVTRLEVKPLEAGGAELHFSFVNESEQTIHYVYYGVTFYDAEGTVISLESTGAEICERVASGLFAHGGGAEETEGAVRYVDPPGFSPAFDNNIASLINNTLSQAGATQAALGDIRPDNTSAIIQAREAATLPLQTVQNRYYRFCEDIARIWAEFWVTMYGSRRLKIKTAYGICPLTETGIAGC